MKIRVLDLLLALAVCLCVSSIGVILVGGIGLLNADYAQAKADDVAGKLAAVKCEDLAKAAGDLLFASPPGGTGVIGRHFLALCERSRTPLFFDICGTVVLLVLSILGAVQLRRRETDGMRFAQLVFVSTALVLALLAVWNALKLQAQNSHFVDLTEATPEETSFVEASEDFQWYIRTNFSVSSTHRKESVVSQLSRTHDLFVGYLIALVSLVLFCACAVNTDIAVKMEFENEIFEESVEISEIHATGGMTMR